MRTVWILKRPETAWNSWFRSKRNMPKISQIIPHQWLEVANSNHPSNSYLSAWFDGSQRPNSVGWYERYFSQTTRTKISKIVKSFQWWDGEFWLEKPGGKKSKLQVGSHPAWRGLSMKLNNGDEVTLLRGSKGRPAGLVGSGCERRVRARLDSIDASMNVFCTLLEDDPMATVHPTMAGESGCWHGLSFLFQGSNP